MTPVPRRLSRSQVARRAVADRGDVPARVPGARLGGALAPIRALSLGLGLGLGLGLLLPACASRPGAPAAGELPPGPGPASASAPAAPAGATSPAFKPVAIVPGPRHPEAPGDVPSLLALTGRDADIRDVLLVLFDDSELNYMIEDDVEGLLSFDLRETSHEQALTSLLRNLRLAHRYERDVVHIGRLERRLFDLRPLADAAVAEGLSGSLWDQLAADVHKLLDDEDGSVLVSPVTRVVEIEARPGTVAKVEAYLDTVMRWVARTERREQALAERYHFAWDPAGTAFPGPAPARGAPRATLSRRGLARVSFLAGADAAAAGERHRALKQLEESLVLDPDLIEAHLTAAAVELQAHELERAQAHVDRALGLRPEDPVARTLAGLIDLRRGLPGAAVDDLERVHLSAPGPVASNNLAVALISAGRHASALEVLQGLDPARTLTPQPHLNRAYLYLLAGQLGQAEHDLHQAARKGVADDDDALLALRAMAHQLRAYGEVHTQPATPRHDPSDDVPTSFLDGWH